MPSNGLDVGEGERKESRMVPRFLASTAGRAVKAPNEMSSVGAKKPGCSHGHVRCEMSRCVRQHWPGTNLDVTRTQGTR